MPLTRAVAAECEVEGRGAPELRWVAVERRIVALYQGVGGRQTCKAGDKTCKAGAVLQRMLHVDSCRP